MAEIRIAGIQWYAEPDGERPLHRRGDETGHMGRAIVRDRCPDVLHQPGPSKNLLRQRIARAVVAAQQREPPARMTEGDAR